MQQYLRALALARLITGREGGAGVPEFVAVIDADRPNGNDEACIDWGIDVEIPSRIAAELLDTDNAAIVGVVVRNGVVLHAS